MAPGYRQPEEPWDQRTEVFEPIQGNYEASGDGPPPPRVKQWVIIGLTALLVGGVLTVGGLFVTGAFNNSGGSDAAPPATAQTTPAPTSSARALPVPAPGASLASVAAWVKAGTPVDLENFHTATDSSDGKVTDLGAAVAFTSPSQKLRCMSPRNASADRPGMNCLVQYDDPPSRPEGAPSHGNWVGNWTTFDGAQLGIGRLAGDPGDFSYGDGATLNYGSRITFNEFDCRMDQAGLFCVNESAGIAAQLNSAGVEPFGCLGEIDSEDYGVTYACGSASDRTTTTKPSPTKTPAADGQPTLGAECDTAGRKAKAADGSNLTCDTASDSSLRWLGY
ncbi:hypothetical protein [Nocardia sp. XZ_19_385]|uniref:hypothetical protein n=1 Tax=Nocardia sp. XZ_19_385 TaxID=2769488 RepID=UPI00188FF273|nr:hypothetical protein [Nocardia sp. XZ_19_385]